MTRQTGEATLNVKIQSFGPTEAELSRLGNSILKHSALQNELRDTKFRLLSIAAIDEISERKSLRPRVPTRFRAVLYDYGKSRALIAEGPLANPKLLSIEESAEQPPVTDQEFAEAVALLEKNREFGKGLKGGELVAYPPMPPVIDVQADDGSTRRLVAVGLFHREELRRLEILGVDLADGSLHRFDDRAPHNANPGNDSMCGAPTSAGQSTATQGTAGQVWITVKQSGKTLWRFLAVRPAASSGINGSGIELRFVDYRGKRVLYRAHVPILNVKYDRDACGPYRDWQYQEGQINAVGTNVASGFKLCSSPATTIMQTGSDTGNFLGVGIYVAGQEVVLVSEMQAGWYRYVSEWRLHANGTIRPRFGFAATYSPCVCNVHHHHAYWRFDFDIINAGGNRVEEYNDPPLVGGGNWHQKRYEIARPRDYGRKRKWRIKHVASGAGYEVRPNTSDGVATQHPDWPFGRGDVWILRYRGTEIDDGVPMLGSPSEAQIGKWVNGESIESRDVVLWYAGHFTHDISHDDPATHGHVVGPDLVPVSWP